MHGTIVFYRSKRLSHNLCTRSETSRDRHVVVVRSDSFSAPKLTSDRRLVGRPRVLREDRALGGKQDLKKINWDRRPDRKMIMLRNV